MPDSIALTVSDAGRAVSFYRDVFDATELQRESLMDGRILTAALLVGPHHVVVSEWESTPAGRDTTADAPVLVLECAGPADVLRRAVAAGAEPEPGDAAVVPGVVLRDPAGQRWRVVDQP